MLDAIRKRSGSIVVKILLGLLVISFGIWGVNDVYFPTPGRAVVASVGSTDIVGVELQNEINREMSRLQRQVGNVDREQARAMGLSMQVVDRMVTQALYDQATQDLGLVASDPLVRDTIRDNPAFFGGLGRFDRLAYEQMLSSNGYSEDTFVQLVRRDVRRIQLLSALMGGATPPKAMTDTLYRYRNEKRLAQVLLVRDADATTPEDPGDDILRTFYESNGDLFTAPEYRKLTAVVLAVDQLAKGISVSDDELRDAYAREHDRFSVAERRTVRQMVFTDKAQAEAARAKLTAGGDFVAVAKELTGADPATLELGVLTRDQALPEMADAIFSLDKDAYSEPVQTPFGWHILQVTAIEAGSEKPLEEVRDELTQMVAREHAVDVMIDLSTKLENELDNGATIEEAGAKLEIPVLSIEGVDATGRAPDGEPIESLPHAANFLDTAFAAPQGEPSRLTEGGTDSYFVVRVDSITPPAIRPFETVRTDVLSSWQADRRKEGARTLANDILQRLAADGGDLAALAAEHNLKMEAVEPIVRDARQGTQPPALRDLVFATEVGGFGMAEASNGTYIVHVDEIQPADPAADTAGVKSLHDSLKGAMEGDLHLAFTNALRKTYPVSINSKAVDEAF